MMHQDSLQRERGFTLLEVLVAMIIIMGAVTLVTNAWTGNLNRLEKSRINNTTALLLQRKMTEVELKYADKAISEIPEEEAGDFGAAYPQYKWVMESKQLQLPSLTDVLASREGGVDQTTLTVVTQFVELMNKATKEVAVTVIYTSRRTKTEVKQTVATYFVDYNTPLSFGGMSTGAGGAGP